MRIEIVFVAFLFCATCAQSSTNSTSVADSNSVASKLSSLISDPSVAGTLGVALISLIGSCLSAAFGLFWSKRSERQILEQRKALARLEDDHNREVRERQEDQNLRSIFRLYSKPLAMSAFELQSRLSTMLGDPPASKPLLYTMCTEVSNQKLKEYGLYHTMFLFGEFLAWVEIIRRKTQGFKLSSHDYVAMWRCHCGWQTTAVHDLEVHRKQFNSKVLSASHSIDLVWMCTSCNWEGTSIHHAMDHQSAMKHQAKRFWICTQPGCAMQQGTSDEETFAKHSSTHKACTVWHCSGCGWQKINKDAFSNREVESILCPQAHDAKRLNDLIDSVAFQLSGSTPVQRGLAQGSDKEASDDDREFLFQLLAGEQREIGEVMTVFDAEDWDGHPETTSRVLNYSEFLEMILRKPDSGVPPIGENLNFRSNVALHRAFEKLKSNLEELAKFTEPPRHRITILQHMIIKLVESIDPTFEFIKKGRLKPIVYKCAHCKRQAPEDNNSAGQGETCNCRSGPSCLKQQEYEKNISMDSSYVRIEKNLSGRDTWAQKAPEKDVSVTVDDLPELPGSISTGK